MWPTNFMKLRFLWPTWRRSRTQHPILLKYPEIIEFQDNWWTNKTILYIFHFIVLVTKNHCTQRNHILRLNLIVKQTSRTSKRHNHQLGGSGVSLQHPTIHIHLSLHIHLNRQIHPKWCSTKRRLHSNALYARWPCSRIYIHQHVPNIYIGIQTHLQNTIMLVRWIVYIII